MNWASDKVFDHMEPNKKLSLSRSIIVSGFGLKGFVSRIETKTLEGFESIAGILL